MASTAKPILVISVCETCHRGYIKDWSLHRCCPECRRTNAVPKRVTLPVAPNLYDRRDVAQYHPGGNPDQVWRRIRLECRAAKGGA